MARPPLFLHKLHLLPLLGDSDPSEGLGLLPVIPLEMGTLRKVTKKEKLPIN
jgi:hypothetical protein